MVVVERGAPPRPSSVSRVLVVELGVARAAPEDVENRLAAGLRGRVVAARAGDRLLEESCEGNAERLARDVVVLGCADSGSAAMPCAITVYFDLERDGGALGGKPSWDGVPVAKRNVGDCPVGFTGRRNAREWFVAHGTG